MKISAPPNKRIFYELSWLTYILFSWMAFPTLSETVMVFSIALSIVGTWFYGYRGWIGTFCLTSLYNYFLLSYYSDTPLMWSKAFHPAGSSTQLCISGLVALMRSKDIQIKHLNRVLEQRVEERTHQLNEIRTHIIENSDSERMMLGLSVLHEIDASLVRMKLKCLELENKLNRRKLIKPPQLVSIASLISDSISSIKQMEFMEGFTQSDPSTLEHALDKLTDYYKETAGTHFVILIDPATKDLSIELSMHLYRIAHEAVTNAIKHARPDWIEISINVAKEDLTLTVTNNGKSMSTDRASGIGMKLIQHRAEILNGNIQYENTDEETTFICTVPTIDFKNV